MEVRRLVRDPANELRDFRILPQLCGVRTNAIELSIGEIRMDRAVTNRMDRNRTAPAFALGNRVMPLDAPADRSLAQPATSGVRVTVPH